MKPLEEYRQSFNYEWAFSSWWFEIAPEIAKLVGHEQTWWMWAVLKDHWKHSPTATNIVNDRWEDERRKENESDLPTIDKVELLHQQIVNLVGGYND